MRRTIDTGSGGRSATAGGVRASALWGKGGRGIIITIIAVAGFLASFAGVAAGSGKPGGGGTTGSTTTSGTTTTSSAAHRAFITKKLDAATKASPKALFKVIVKGSKGQSTSNVASEQSATITANPQTGTGIKKQYTVINATASTLSGKQIQSLLTKTKIFAVTEDVQLRGTAISNPQLWPQASGASSFWASSASVSTPTIAIVDSGIDPLRVADFGGRVLANANVVGGQGNTAGADGFGHGTFVASIAAGGADGYSGAAPTTNLVSVDVLDDSGSGTMADVIDGAEWIFKNQGKYNIKVANFSLLAGTNSSFRFDPLCQAVEKLWLNGITVVVAAGNYASNGAPSGILYAPANDPFVITVGASDIGSTLARSDDFNAPWSAYGYTLDGFSKPELGAPGRHMNGAVPEASTMLSQHSERSVGPGYMWMSGTSFAAPVVSGIAAQLLGRHPDWGPDQVKGALMLSAKQAGAASAKSLGVGEVDGAAANAVSSPPNPNAGLNQFVVSDSGSGNVFDSASWANAAQANASWNTASWSSASWSSASWSSASWSSASWSSASWSSASWSSGQTVDGSIPTASWATLTWVS